MTRSMPRKSRARSPRWQSDKLPSARLRAYDSLVMARHFDHIDLRVSSLDKVRNFYHRLLPALGFTIEADVEGWIQFYAQGENGTEFFGVTESPGHKPNENRIAFWAESPEAVDAFLPLLAEIGAHHI